MSKSIAEVEQLAFWEFTIWQQFLLAEQQQASQALNERISERNNKAITKSGNLLTMTREQLASAFPKKR